MGGGGYVTLPSLTEESDPFANLPWQTSRDIKYNNLSQPPLCHLLLITCSHVTFAHSKLKRQYGWEGHASASSTNYFLQFTKHHIQSHGYSFPKFIMQTSQRGWSYSCTCFAYTRIKKNKQVSGNFGYDGACICYNGVHIQLNLI